MKSTRIIYWTTTILFAAFMIFSAIPNIIVNEDSIKFLHEHLGYPVYFISFIGMAKLLGSITILIPRLRIVKEWAYAGLFFDLTGAVYSNIKVDGFQPEMLTMLPVFAVAITSYLYNRKLYGQIQVKSATAREEIPQVI